MTKFERDTDGTLQKYWNSLGVWKLEIVIVDISVDVWQKSSVTPMELAKSIEIP